MADSNIEVKTVDPFFEVIEFEDIMTSFPEEDKCGLRVTSGSITLIKEKNSLIGVSIGGGIPYCPCIYIVQIFENTLAAKDGTLEAGDEIIAVDRQNVKGLTRAQVAKMIQKAENEVTLYFNKLHVDDCHGKSVDIALKKMKHRIVEIMNSSTADFLGLTRAVLINDTLVKRLETVKNLSKMFWELSLLTGKYNAHNKQLADVHKKMAEVFDEIGIKESQTNISQAFLAFARGERSMQRYSESAYDDILKIAEDLKLFVKKVIPDTENTIKKYLNAKFEYLAYCLKVKEMDDEESCCNAAQELLYRVESGNYEYRLMLRRRQESKKKFIKMRNDVLEKLDLLDNKHVQDIVKHLGRLMDIFKNYFTMNYSVWKDASIFPIEIDLCSYANLNDQQGGLCDHCLDNSLNGNSSADEDDDSNRSSHDSSLLE